MKRTEDIFRIYMSHAIRGPKGQNATKKDIEENIAKHIKIGTEIKAYLIDWEKMDGLPRCDLYIPAEHDEFVQIAFDKKYLDEKKILDVDCEIIERCNLVIAFGDPLDSRGMQIELDYAANNGIPIFFMPTLDANTIHTLNYTIKLILGE